MSIALPSSLMGCAHTRHLGASRHWHAQIYCIQYARKARQDDAEVVHPRDFYLHEPKQVIAATHSMLVFCSPPQKDRMKKKSRIQRGIDVIIL
jgi:hypothetical protein